MNAKTPFGVFLLYLENPALDVGFRIAYSYAYDKKTPSDIIKMRSGNCTLRSEGGHSNE